MKTWIVIMMCFYSITIFGQDIIVLKNGGDIEAKVLEIRDNDIKYKKYSNLSGPTYTLAKNEIFIIKYESGDKDDFSGYSGGMVKSGSSGFVYDPNMGTIGCQSNKKFGVRLYGDQANQVFFRNDIVFYGYDFTYLKLTNARKANDGIDYVGQYVNKWNDLLMQELLPIPKLKKWMDKPNMYWGTGVYSNYRFNQPANFVVPVNYCISINEIEQIVASYELNETQGIGMVINVVNFNKPNETASVYVTFFDIQTREILFATYAIGKAGGSGMDGHWAEGINSAVRELFIDLVYKPKRSNNGMIPGKLLLY